MTKAPTQNDDCPEDLIPTRSSLLGRLKNWEDSESWQAFFNTYWRLIYSFALQRGLHHEEAQEVVQETVVAVAKSISKFTYEPQKCAFKTWLLSVDGWARVPGPIGVQLENGAYSLMDPISFKEVHRLFPSRTNAQRDMLAIAPTGHAWAISEYSEKITPKTLDLWREETNGLRHFKLPHPAPIFATITSFSPDETHLISYCKDRKIRVWRTSDGTLEQTIPLAEGLKRVWMFLPDGKRALVRREDDELALLEIVSQMTLCAFAPLPRAVKPPETGYEDDRKSRIAVTGNGQAVIYDIETGKILAPPFRHWGGVGYMNFSPDGGRCLTAGTGHTVKVWDTATGEPLLWLQLSGSARFSDWSADGRFIATRSDDNFARAWDGATGEPVTPILKHDNLIVMSVVTAGNRLVTGSMPNLIRSWELKPTALAPEVIADYARLLAGRRLGASGMLLPLNPAELEQLYRSLRRRVPRLFERQR